jgi:hypothetical protein
VPDISNEKELTYEDTLVLPCRDVEGGFEHVDLEDRRTLDLRRIPGWRAGGDGVERGYGTHRLLELHLKVVDGVVGGVLQLSGPFALGLQCSLGKCKCLCEQINRVKRARRRTYEEAPRSER